MTLKSFPNTIINYAHSVCSLQDFCFDEELFLSKRQLFNPLTTITIHFINSFDSVSPIFPSTQRHNDDSNLFPALFYVCCLTFCAFKTTKILKRNACYAGFSGNWDKYTDKGSLEQEHSSLMFFSWQFQIKKFLKANYNTKGCSCGEAVAISLAKALQFSKLKLTSAALTHAIRAKAVGCTGKSMRIDGSSSTCVHISRRKIPQRLLDILDKKGRWFYNLCELCKTYHNVKGLAIEVATSIVLDVSLFSVTQGPTMKLLRIKMKQDKKWQKFM